MRAIASRARNLLPDPATTVAFLRGCVNSDGGFRGRSPASDLYYTVFGLESLAALDEPPPPATADYLRRFEDIESLDFVHATCLARCWGSFPDAFADSAKRKRIIDRIERARTPDGGYSQWSDSHSATHGTAYGCILALGTYQDLAPSPASRLAPSTVDEMPNPTGLRRCLDSLRTPDGGYVNEPGQSAGQTPATAAAIAVQAAMGQPADPMAVRWLMDRALPAGGFAAMPGLPIADLLSTATGLFALAGANAPPLALHRATRRFVQGLHSAGGFCGHAFDSVRDCEYTFYGLLTLGCLASCPSISG